MAKLELPDKLIEAVAEAKRITNFEGKRRQMQFVGKLMRQLDPAVLDAVRAALVEQHMPSARENLRLLHTAEQWRDRLIADDEARGRLDQGSSRRPTAQQLRALVRQARKDAITRTKPRSAGLVPRQGRAYRDIFQLVREHAGALGATLPTTPSGPKTMTTIPPAHGHPPLIEIGIVSISDRASSGVYEDKGLPALQDWLAPRAEEPHRASKPRLIPDEQALHQRHADRTGGAPAAALVLTTGGTGPALRDVTPEATLAVAHKEMPGFGEQMRQISLKFVPTAILSRQVAVIRDQIADHQPARATQIDPVTLEGLRDAEGQVPRPASLPPCPTASISSAGTWKPMTRCAPAFRP